MDLKSFVPTFTEADISRAVAREKLKTGTYHFQVVKVDQKVNEKGNMVLTLRLLPLDANGQVMRPGANLSLVGPFKTSPELLQAQGLPPNGQPNGAPRTSFIVEGYARARKNPTNPSTVTFPTIQTLKQINGQWKVVDAAGVPTGEELEAREARAEKVKEAERAARNFYAEAWASGGEMLVGDRFYGTVSYNTAPGAYDGPQVSVTKSQDPETITDLVDTTEGIVEDADTE